jgi:hypothetical protein
MHHAYAILVSLQLLLFVIIADDSKRINQRMDLYDILYRFSFTCYRLIYF